jgi:hypothetical protein
MSATQDDRADKWAVGPFPEEVIRGVLAFWFVGILVWLQFRAPSGDAPAGLVTATQTIAISVVAFYFGQHLSKSRRERIALQRQVEMNRSAVAPDQGHTPTTPDAPPKQEGA